MESLYDAPIDDEEGVPRVAGRINRFTFAKMADTGQLADGLPPRTRSRRPVQKAKKSRSNISILEAGLMLRMGRASNVGGGLCAPTFLWQGSELDLETNTARLSLALPKEGGVGAPRPLSTLEEVASAPSGVQSSAMPEVAYLFERFPSFGQTFSYREVAELERQGTTVHVFSIRRPLNEPEQDWDTRLVERVHYLPDEKPLAAEVDRLLRGKGVTDEMRSALKKWGRQPDFLRLYQAIYVGLHLRKKGLHQIHAHFAGMAARTVDWIREFFAIPYTFTAHANDIFAPRDFVVSLTKLIENAAGVVTVSDYAVRLLQERFPSNSAKIRRVYNGVDLARYQPSDFGSSPPAIVSIGRLIEKKGFSELITSCALLRARDRDFFCSIIGEGPLEESLRAQITANGLEKSVELTGPLTQTQIAARLGRATLFVLPCRREADGGMDNLPTVIMEAMAAGLPVISTPLGGIPEMVEPGVNGELVPERNPEVLGVAMEGLLTDTGRARSLGNRGREIALARNFRSRRARGSYSSFSTAFERDPLRLGERGLAACAPQSRSNAPHFDLA